MVQRYDDWDKKRYKTFRSMPWWSRKIHIIQYIGWATVFVWAFGGIYKQLLFPSRDVISRSLDPRYGDDAEFLRQNIKKREEALVRRTLGEKETDPISDLV